MYAKSRERIIRIIACYEELARLEGPSEKGSFFQKRLEWWKKELEED